MSEEKKTVPEIADEMRRIAELVELNQARVPLK